VAQKTAINSWEYSPFDVKGERSALKELLTAGSGVVKGKQPVDKPTSTKGHSGFLLQERAGAEGEKGRHK